MNQLPAARPSRAASGLMSLVDTELDEIEQHVEDCADCQRALEELTDATHWDVEPAAGAS